MSDARETPAVREMCKWRQHIHQHPELGFAEATTSAYVAELLEGFGISVERGIGGYGVVGKIEIGDSRKGPRIAMRADMDALPIQEQTGLPYASKTPGVMHACGHDGHTAMLLGGAELIQRRIRAGQIGGNGTIILIFQPAEEVGGSQSGARRMLDDGLLARYPYDEVFGIHNGPVDREGVFYFREGPFMFGSNTYEIEISGVSSHGAQPHFAKDASLAMASTILALHTITSQSVNPLERSMLSVGIATAGNNFNVIPDKARIVLSSRSLNPEVGPLIERRIREVVHAQTSAFGCTGEVRRDPGYPCVVNDAGSIAFASAVASDLFGSDRVVMDADPVSASEDFSLFMADRPGAYFMIGNGDNGWKNGERIGRCPVHTPFFDFNDNILPVGAAFWAELAQKKCEQAAALRS